jgi:FlaG/FlaF family flagellin (archaellin)
MTPNAGRSSSNDGSGAFGLGSRRAVRLTVWVAVVLVAVAAWAIFSGGTAAPAPVHPGMAATSRPVTSSTGHHTASVAKYGGLPAWLPRSKVAVGRVLHASRAHPALSIQGETVSVDLGHAKVLVTATGPRVPEEGRTPVPQTSPCAFTVTFTHASRAIPISGAAFTFVDELGHVRHPRVTSVGGGAPPRQLAPGQTVSLTVRDVLPTGDGALTWAPGGGRPIASWDFDVEID